MILAHIAGVPFEELINPVEAYVMASAAALLVGVIGRRWRR